MPALFSASKLGGVWLADMNGDGVVDNGDRLYFVDDGTVGGQGTGGLYVATWNDSNTQNAWNTPNNAAAIAAGFVDHWSLPVRLGDAPVQTGSGNVGQLRGITGTVINATIATASETSTTVTISLAGAIPGSFTVGSNVEISGVGAGYDGSWTITAATGNTFTYTATATGLGTVNGAGSATQAIVYTSAFDNAANDSSFIQQWVDTNTGVSISDAKEPTGNTVTITTATPSTFRTGQVVEIDGVGANNGAAAITTGYNGAWQITVIDSTHFTYVDTNGSGLAEFTNQGAANVVIHTDTDYDGQGGTVIQALAGGTDTVNGSTNADIGLRGVAFAPVAATSVTLTQSPANPLSPGTTVTLTATLANSQVTPSGTVAFIDQNTNTVLGEAPITTTSGVSTAVFSTVLVGNHYVQAYFSGGGTLALASARSNTLQVIEEGSTASATTVTASLSSAAIGKQVTFTATVVDNSGGSGTPTGTVSFYSGSVALANLLGTVPLTTVSSSQEAQFVAAFSTAGTQTIVGEYNGDNNFAHSDGSASVSVAANASGAITSSANNVALNATPTYTATIVGNSTLGTPTGSVVFTIVSATDGTNGKPLVSASSGSMSLTAGSGNTATATWTSPALSAAGSYFITISYTASGASNPYSSFAIDTTSATNGVALIENVQQAFAPGDLVAVQRGDGTVNLGSNSYPVFVDEYTTGGSLVQSIALPNTDAGGQHALFLSGQNGAEGLLNRSTTGYDLTLMGYDLPIGHTFITSTFPYQYPRTIADIGSSGSTGIDTSTAIGIVGGTGVAASITAASETGTTVTITTSAAHNFQVGQNIIITGITPAGYDGSVIITSVPTGTTFTYAAASGLGTASLTNATATPAGVPYNPTDVVSYDGQEFWIASTLPVGDTTDSGIEYVASVGSSTAVQIGPTGAAAAISISGGQLYVTKGSGNVQAVGTGLPTTAGQRLTGLPNLAAQYQNYFPSTENPEQVLLLNTNDGTSNNPNVAYIADQANGLLKFWNNTATISSLSETSTTVTVTTSAANTLVSGEQVGISGASVAGYNGVYTITVVDSTHFTYTDATSGLGAATGGTASQWNYGGSGGIFGQKLVFAGGATGVTGYVINPGASNAEVQLYVTGVNVTQQNPNQIDSFLDTHGAAAGSGGNGVDQGFPSGNFSVTAFVGGEGGSGSPNGNENFAGLAFAPAAQTITTVTSSSPTATENTSVTFTATVTSSFDTPAGVVQFFDGTKLLGQATLSSGVATFTSGPLSVGVHTITATYQGSVTDGMSSGTLLQNMDFISNNLIVTQVGTGSGSLTTSTAATFLDEYTTIGGSVSSTPLPTANAATATISGITESGTTATVTTTAASGFAVGEKVTISGASVSGYNGTFTITAVPSATTFTFTAGSGLGSATGGTASVVLDLTETGNATAEGYLTDSADGHSLTIAGYNVAPGSSTTGVNRDIAVVGPNAAVDLSTQLPSSNTNVRVAVSADGLGFWVATSTGVVYVPFGNPGAAATNVSPEVPTTSSSPFTVGIDTNNTSGSGNGTPGQLFGSAGAGAQTSGVPPIDSPFTIGSGLTQVGGSAITVSPSFPTTTDTYGNFPVSNQFAVSSDGNTIFIADSRTDSLGGIYEYYQSSANSWALVGHLQLNSSAISDAKETGTTVTITTSSAYSFPAGQQVEIDGVGTGYNGKFTITQVDSTHFTYPVTASGLGEVSGAGVATSTDGGLRALVADFSTPSAPILYATTSATSGNRLVKITGGTTDGNNATFSATSLQTAAANTAFRGVAMTPTAPGTTSSTTTLSVTGSPGNYGAGVTLAATVTSGATGWVSFRNQATGAEIGAAPIVGTTATLVTAGNLPASGSAYNIVAIYTGDTTYAASTSSAKSATVNQATVGVNLNASPSPVATGVNVTLGATLTGVPAGTTPTGTVTFKDGSTTLGTGNIGQVVVNVSGSPVIEFVASFTTVFTTTGTHNLSAVYNGDTNFNTATGTKSVLVVNPTYVTVTSSNAAPTAAPSVTVTYTATVASPGGTPTGTVQFYDNLLPIGSAVTLNGSGVATVTINTALVQAASGDADVLTPGQHAISAVYTPDTAGQNTYFTSTDDYIQNVQNQPFSAADTFVYRVGDGTTPLNPSSPSTVAGSIGSTIFVDEYTAAGTLVQSIALPTADGPYVGISAATESSTTVTITTGVANSFSVGQQVVISGVTPAGYNGTFTITSIIDSTHFTYTDATSSLAGGTGGTATTSTVHAVVGNGQQSSTGQMSLSGDGQFLFVSGYDTNPLNVAAAPGIPTNSGNVTRSIARIGYTGTIQELAMTPSNSGSSFGNFNAVYSPDGNQVYVGGNGGVVYYSSFSQSPAPWHADRDDENRHRHRDRPSGDAGQSGRRRPARLRQRRTAGLHRLPEHGGGARQPPRLQRRRRHRRRPGHYLLHRRLLHPPQRFGGAGRHQHLLPLRRRPELREWGDHQVGAQPARHHRRHRVGHHGHHHHRGLAQLRQQPDRGHRRRRRDRLQRHVHHHQRERQHVHLYRHQHQFGQFERRHRLAVEGRRPRHGRHRQQRRLLLLPQRPDRCRRQRDAVRDLRQRRQQRLRSGPTLLDRGQ